MMRQVIAGKSSINIQQALIEIPSYINMSRPFGC